MKVLFALAAQALLFLVLAGLSGSVDTGVLRQRFRARKSIIFGVACQFLILPFLGFSSAKAFDLDPVYGIMLITVTSSPGGAFSNWWCSTCNADLALSIAMTTCSTILSCGLTPLNMLFYSYCAYGEHVSVDFLNLVQPVIIGAVAILMGLMLSHCFPKLRWIWNLIGNICGVLLIVLNATVSSRTDPVWDKEANFYASVAMPCTCSLLVALILAKVSRQVPAPEAVAIAVEVCFQNTGLAMAIAISSFPERDASRAAGVPLFYAALQVLVLPIFLLVAWRLDMTYASKNEPIWRVIFLNHQPALDPTKENVLPVPGPPSPVAVGNRDVKDPIKEQGVQIVPARNSQTDIEKT